MTARRFFRELAYPVVHGGPAAAILFFALLIQLALAAGLIGLWLLIIAGAAGAKFLVLVLRARALGVDPPVPEAGLFNLTDRAWTLAAWLFLGALFLLARQATDWLGTGPGSLLVIAGLVVFPAATLRLAITGSPLEMLRPGAVAGVIRGTGASYVVIFAGTAIIGTAAWLAGRQPAIPGFVEVLLTAWALVTFFSLAGAVFYGRRVELGLPVQRSPERTEERARRYAERDRAEVLDHAYGLASRGNGAAGISHIRGWLERSDADPEAWDWFYDRLGRWESSRPRVAFGRHYIARLAREGMWQRAVEVADDCLAADPAFRPAPEDRQGLAAAARRIGATRLVARLES